MQENGRRAEPGWGAVPRLPTCSQPVCVLLGKSPGHVSLQGRPRARADQGEAANALAVRTLTHASLRVYRAPPGHVVRHWERSGAAGASASAGWAP